MSNQQTILQTLFHAFTDKALKPGDAYYEPFLQTQAYDPIAELKATIDFSESESLSLVSGQRGTGKSTELLRLKDLLEKSGCIVLLSDIRDYLSLTEPVEISDFLISALSSLADLAKRDHNLDTIHEHYITRMARFLHRDVKFEPLAITAKTGDFGATLKASLSTDASFKQKLQEATKGHIGQLVEDAQAFVVELVQALRGNNPNQKIVFIVDSLEQLRGTASNTEAVYDSVVRLFNTYGHHLRLPQLHVVITVPPYLIPSSPNIARYLGGNPITTLPSIHVKHPDGTRDEHGLQTLQAILKRRGADVSTVFPDALIETLAQASGGDLRDFFRLTRHTLIKASTKSPIQIPVAANLIEQSLDGLRQEMLPIANDDVQWLAKITQNKGAELPSMENLPKLARFFDGNLVINYKNGKDWYDVHPLIRDYILSRNAILAPD